MLREIPSKNLAVYAVWEPILRTDDERSSRRATTLSPDERVTNYWASTTDVGTLFQSPIGLTTEPAWDVYLFYPPGVKWESDVPPRPEFFMHQLGGRLPDDSRLDGHKLAESIKRMLSK